MEGGIRVEEEGGGASKEDEGGDGVGGFGDEVGEPCELGIERGGDGVIDTSTLVDLAEFGVVTDGRDTEGGVSIEDGGAFEGGVGGVGGIGVVVVRVGRFAGGGFAGEGGLVDEERDGVKE